jgi:hypothetical protein
MSISSASPSSPSVSSFAQRSNLLSDKTLVSATSRSQVEREPKSRFSLRALNKEQYYQTLLSRNRTLSTSEEAPGDTVPETIVQPVPTNTKNEKRTNENKSSSDRNNPPAVDRRYSTPQSHFSALFRLHRHQSMNTSNVNDKTNIK